jgi:hypothetical protein
VEVVTARRDKSVSHDQSLVIQNTMAGTILGQHSKSLVLILVKVSLQVMQMDG